MLSYPIKMLSDGLLMMPSKPGESPLPGFLAFGLIIVVFYFFMIRPQLRKAKDQKKFLESINKGDRVVTIGGVHGKIAEVRDTTYILDVEGGGRLKVEKSAISHEFTKRVKDQKDA